jgi:GT2 family glycosyltransferase
MKRDFPVVSFVIPVRNDAERLGRCIRSILATRYPADRVEILVADNGSVDDSAGVARRAGATVLDLPGLSVAQLRNRAAQGARGSILAFVDADHEIVPGWLEGAAETMGDERVGAVGALCEAPSDGTWVQRTYDLLRRRPGGIRDVEWLGSGNMAVLHQPFEALGGFDVSLHTCEDVDLCRRLRGAGWRVVQDPRLRNVHLGDPATLGDLFRSELWRGRDNLRASLRGPVRLAELPSVVYPVAELALLGLGLTGLAVGSIAGLSLSALSIGGIAAAAGARAARMVVRAGHMTPRAYGQAFAVAATYDLARAVALIRPRGYETRRRAQS